MQYDYIFAGSGGAGLSLAYRMSKHPAFKDKKILLLDKAPKNSNDRTWCFWTKESTPFDEVVCNQWDKFWFRSPSFTQCIDLNPYQYKMIRSLDFYQFIQKELSQNPQITQRYGEIKTLQEGENGAHVVLDDEIITSQFIFNSLPDERLFQKKGYHYLKQHFKGWFVRTKEPIFDPQAATFMDFRIEQKKEARFFYLLPSSPYESLVEFTIFSENLLPQDEYVREIEHYFKNYLPPTEFEILEEEFGVIPMSDVPLKANGGRFILNIGTRGGQTKASSGFTFMNMQKQSEQIIEALVSGKDLQKISFHKERFMQYDSILLNLIQYDRFAAREIFGMLFKKHPVERVLRFLDGETNFGEELQIMASVPPLPFITSLFHKTFIKDKF